MPFSALLNPASIDRKLSKDRKPFALHIASILFLLESPNRYSLIISLFILIAQLPIILFFINLSNSLLIISSNVSLSIFISSFSLSLDTQIQDNLRCLALSTAYRRRLHYHGIQLSFPCAILRMTIQNVLPQTQCLCRLAPV